MVKGDPLLSPWHWEAADYLGRKVQIDVAFNNSTKAIVNPGLTGTRDTDCLYTTVIIGTPGSGTEKTFNIPTGSFSVGRVQLSNQGFDTITDILDSNFTLGT